ncbi:hypothetical protein L596_022110 [Steinernema carpocapsae]|uniref:Amiloride-sensitive sodium channel n=1 Tax=Steinernema carpocapsae TaxID=34508 RepID=A0A4U5MKT5_STECR|nr:hypothetical protein L596_022110 [Steinernema carpocapsae]
MAHNLQAELPKIKNTQSTAYFHCQLRLFLRLLLTLPHFCFSCHVPLLPDQLRCLYATSHHFLYQCTNNDVLSGVLPHYCPSTVTRPHSSRVKVQVQFATKFPKPPPSASCFHHQCNSIEDCPCQVGQESLEPVPFPELPAPPWRQENVMVVKPSKNVDRKRSVDSATQYECSKRRISLPSYNSLYASESGSDSDFDVLELLYDRVRKKLNRQKSSYSTSMEDEEHRTWKDVFCGKRMKKWAFWFIVAFLAILTIKDVIDLIMEYSGNPKQSDMNIMFNESMTMPNVTFCMSREQAWSHFKLNETEPPDAWDQAIQDNLMNMTDHDSFLQQPWDYRMVMEAYEVIATFSSMERETTPHGSVRSINVYRSQPRLAAKRKMAKMWLEVIKDRGVTFEEFTQKTGTEVIKRSMQRFQRTTYDEDLVIRTRLRTSWISMMQFCFQPWFDEDNFKTIDDQGNFFTMMLSHNAENLNGKQVECMSVDFHGRPSSLSRFMEGKGRARDGFNDELCAGMRHEVSVEVRARYIMLENDDEGTACREVEEDEDNEFDCRSRCRMIMIRDVCNCTAATLSYLVDDDELEKFPICDYESCVVDVQSKNFTDADCSASCYRDCDQIRYEIDHESKGRMVRPDLTLIDLNWGSFEYLTLEQDWVWTVPSFIAALGGSIGMWLGLSILSLIQGGTYLYSVITDAAKKKLIKAKSTPNVQPMEPGKGENRFKENPFASPYKKSPNSKSFDSQNGGPPSYDPMTPNTRISVE